jgi:hypothetical protein
MPTSSGSDSASGWVRKIERGNLGKGGNARCTRSKIPRPFPVEEGSGRMLYGTPVGSVTTTRLDAATGHARSMVRSKSEVRDQSAYAHILVSC